MLTVIPTTFDEACSFIVAKHRHHGAPRGWKFGAGLFDGSELRGVVAVGRPVSRMLCDGFTVEVIRCCVDEGVRNGCSKLYGAALRASRALGYRRVVTYTLASESGSSLRAVGFVAVAETRAESWDRVGRSRVDPSSIEPKTRWELVF